MKKNIWIFGGANVDICGIAHKPLIHKDSNKGTIAFSYGGVGRNIAQAAALCSNNNDDINVNLITCISDDDFGHMIKDDCLSLGIDISKSVMVNNKPTSIYLAILDDNRDMSLGMSDMRILDELDEKVIHNVMPLIREQDIIVVDSNFNLELLNIIIKSAPCRIACDPVSVNKMDVIKSIISNISIFKPNEIEAEYLTGIKITDEDSARASLKWFLEKGIDEVIITLGEAGVLIGVNRGKSVCHNHGPEEGEYGMLWLKHRATQMKNATGGGDSLLGAYLVERLKDQSPCEAAEFAIGCAILNIETDAHERHNLTDDVIRANLSSMNISKNELT